MIGMVRGRPGAGTRGGQLDHRQPRQGRGHRPPTTRAVHYWQVKPVQHPGEQPRHGSWSGQLPHEPLYDVRLVEEPGPSFPPWRQPRVPIVPLIELLLLVHQYCQTWLDPSLTYALPHLSVG